MRLVVVLTLFALVLSARSVTAQDSDPCKSPDVVDGVNEAAGVVCDAAAAETARQRFLAVTGAAETARVADPKVCDDAALAATRAKLEGAMAWSKDSRAAQRVIDRDDGILRQLRIDLAREKANPSGVVDLVELHAIGVHIQYYTDERAQSATRAQTSFAHAQKLLAEAKKWSDAPACKARDKHPAPAASSAPASSR